MDNDLDDTLIMLFEKKCTSITIYSFDQFNNEIKENWYSTNINELKPQCSLVIKMLLLFDDDLWFGSSEIEIIMNICLKMVIHCLILHSRTIVYKDTDRYFPKQFLLSGNKIFIS